MEMNGLNGLKSNPKRKCAPASYKLDSDSSSNGSIEKDPFRSSGDDEDKEFLLHPKKKPAIH